MLIDFSILNFILGSMDRKELILKSYHIYDNKDVHHPESLAPETLDLFDTMDESVYKTYINPTGIPQKVSQNLDLAAISYKENLQGM